MKIEELVVEVTKFLQSDEFREGGAVDADGDVDFGPASVAVSDFIETLEEDEDDIVDAEGTDLEGPDPDAK